MLKSRTIFVVVGCLLGACGSADSGKKPNAVGAAGAFGGTSGVGAGTVAGAGNGVAGIDGLGSGNAGISGAAGLSGGAGIDGSTAGTQAAAGSGGTMAAAGSGGGTEAHGSNCLKAGDGSYGEPGPYQVGMMDVDLGMIEASQHTGMYTIFYPMPLETSCLHPIVAWGNGTTVMGSNVYAFFNKNAASWGMVVMASHEDNAGSGAFHKAAIDYLLKQNDDPASMFFHKLSTRAGVSGHSQGAFGATKASNHPNVEAEVSVAGGGVPSPNAAFMCLTGTADQVEAQCTQSYQSAAGPAFLADWMGGDHNTTETLGGYIMKDPGSLAMMRAMAAWFRCHLADDDVACAEFKGAPTTCGLCSDTGWAKHEVRNW